MPGPCSAPNGDATLVVISEDDKIKARKRAIATERPVLPAELFRERRSRTTTGKTRTKRKGLSC